MALEDYFPFSEREKRSPVNVTCEFEGIIRDVPTLKVRRLVAIAADGTKHLDNQLYDSAGIKERFKTFVKNLGDRDYVVNVNLS